MLFQMDKWPAIQQEHERIQLTSTVFCFIATKKSV